MNVMTSRSRGRRAALATLIALGLAGCTGLATLKSVTEPTDLYDLTPKSTYSADLPKVEAQLVVEEPTAASAVDTDRIAVRPNDFQVQYFPRARWVDRAPALVQTMLVESFENTGKVAAVGRQAIGLSADFTLVTDLREFQAEVEQEIKDVGEIKRNEVDAAQAEVIKTIRALVKSGEIALVGDDEE